MIGDKYCLNCGADLTQLPKKRAKVFCDSTCRSNYWQKSDRLEKAGKSTEEIVSILSQLAKNNKPDNKKKIEKERNTEYKIGESHKQPEVDNSAKIKELEEEFKRVTGTSTIAIQRRKFIQQQISKLKL
jgi:uncharacterized Zn finger protein (UPF0148 family)